METLEYFLSVNIPVLDIYGMSESTGTFRQWTRFVRQAHIQDRQQILFDALRFKNAPTYSTGRFTSGLFCLMSGGGGGVEG